MWRKTLAEGFLKHGHEVMVGSRDASKLEEWKAAHAGAKAEVGAILDAFGWETEDMGGAESARAIEALCMLWCIPGFTKNEWTHAFKLLH